MEFAGVRAITRDEASFVLVATAKKVPGVFSPLLAECIAIREGLQFAIDSGLRVQSIESDASLAIQKIANLEVLAPEFPIIEDISRLIGVLGGGSCHAISRLVNGVAHTLARQALVLDNEQFWLQEIPEYLSCIVVNDVIHNQ